MKSWNEFQKNKDDKLKQVEKAKTMSLISYGVGGALLAAGIAVHVWF